MSQFCLVDEIFISDRNINIHFSSSLRFSRRFSVSRLLHVPSRSPLEIVAKGCVKTRRKVSNTEKVSPFAIKILYTSNHSALFVIPFSESRNYRRRASRKFARTIFFTLFRVGKNFFGCAVAVVEMNTKSVNREFKIYTYIHAASSSFFVFFIRPAEAEIKVSAAASSGFIAYTYA